MICRALRSATWPKTLHFANPSDYYTTVRSHQSASVTVERDSFRKRLGSQIGNRIISAINQRKEKVVRRSWKSRGSKTRLNFDSDNSIEKQIVMGESNRESNFPEFFEYKEADKTVNKHENGLDGSQTNIRFNNGEKHNAFKGYELTPDPSWNIFFFLFVAF